MPLRDGLGHAWRVQPELGGFHAADLVAKPRRFLKLEISRRLLHRFFQIGDDGGVVVADKVALLCASGGRHVIGFATARQCNRTAKVP